MVASSNASALEREDHKRDAEFNKAMHGKSAQARGGVAAMLSKNKEAKKAAVDEYFKHWDNQAAKDETEETRQVRSRPLATAALSRRLRLTDRLRPALPSMRL
jgi:sterol 24-C-methyltransferase